MGGSLFSGLVGGFANAGLQREKEERDKEFKEKQLDVQILTAAAQSTTDPEARARILNQADELVSGGSGKKKGGFSLGSLLERLQGKTGGQGGNGGQGGGGTQQSTGAAPQTAGPTTQSGLPGAPTTPQATPPTFGGQPQRQGRFSAADFPDPAEKEIQNAVKMQHAQITAMAQDMYGKDMKSLSPDERAELVHAYYKTPNARMHPILVNGKDADGNTIGVPALQSLDSGAIIGQDGQVVPNAEIYKAPANKRPVILVGDKGQITAGMQDPKTLKVYDANGGAEIQNPRILPDKSYVPSTSVTHSEELDTDSGKMVPKTSTTTKTKGGFDMGAPPSRPQAAAPPKAGAHRRKYVAFRP